MIPLKKPAGLHRINDEITAREVLVISDDGAKLGPRSLHEALGLARLKGLDLVEINTSSVPPVCKLLDYGKFKYEEKKKKKQTRRKLHAGQIKEIRLRPRTDKHDMEHKLEQGRGFLAEGHKLQITITFRGREMSRQDLGRDLMTAVIAQLDDVAKVERPPRQEGRRLAVVFSPKGKSDGKSAKDKQGGGKAVPSDPPRKTAVPPGGQAAPPVGQVGGPPPQAPQVGPA